MTIKWCKIIFSRILKRGKYTQYYCFDGSGPVWQLVSLLAKNRF